MENGVQANAQPKQTKEQQELEWSLNIIAQHMQAAPLTRQQHNEGDVAFQTLQKHLNNLIKQNQRLHERVDVTTQKRDEPLLPDDSAVKDA